LTAAWFGIEPPYSTYGRAKVVIVEAPGEATVSFGKGASKGPQAIREVSHQIELYNPILEAEPYRTGIHGLPPLELPPDPERAVMAVKSAAVHEIETNRRTVLVGGEHSLTAGAVAAYREAYPSLTVLQLDAHADLREEYEGSRFSHACVMRRVADLGVGFVQAGVRSLSGEERDWLADNGREVISSRYVLSRSDWIDRVISGLSECVYLTLDVDVLDPSEMPATGAPEPGGVSYQHIIDLVLALKGSGKQVVGFDLMEFTPVSGLHFPQFTCALLIYTMIGAFFC